MSFRIALVTNSFEDYAGELARRLSDANEVLVIAPDGLHDALHRRVGPKVDLRTYPQHRIRDVRAGVRTARSIERIAREWAPDVVHHQLGGDPWMTLGVQLLARRFGVVTTIHEARARLRDEDVRWAPVARRVAVRHSDEVIVLTDSVAENLRNQGGGARPISVIEIGRVAGGFPRSGDAPTSVARHQLLFFGRIRPYKGLGLLLAASANIASSVEDFRLVVAGSGATVADLFPETTPPWVELQLGFIDDGDVAALFDHSRAVVLPYLEASQSGVGATAMALGCPVITTDAGGLAEGVIDGENGLVVPAGDETALAAAMLSILTNDEFADKLRAGALATAEASDSHWMEITDRTMKVYRRAAQA